MPLYPIQNYTYNNSVNLEVNLEKLFLFHKYQLLKSYSYIKPIAVDEHNSLIDATNDIVDMFRDDIYKFNELKDVEVKWQWIGRILLEQNSLLEKSIILVNKINLE